MIAGGREGAMCSSRYPNVLPIHTCVVVSPNSPRAHDFSYLAIED